MIIFFTNVCFCTYFSISQLAYFYRNTINLFTFYVIYSTIFISVKYSTMYTASSSLFIFFADAPNNTKFYYLFIPPHHIRKLYCCYIFIPRRFVQTFFIYKLFSFLLIPFCILILHKIFNNNTPYHAHLANTIKMLKYAPIIS